MSETKGRILQIVMLGGFWRPWTWQFRPIKMEIRKSLLTGPPLLMWPYNDNSLGMHYIPEDCKRELGLAPAGEPQPQAPEETSK